ncbi:Transmembrane family 220, helix [Alteromonadaceae bacterium Bs31]|nr:Transmembrane family 220, helix [Alteromonadaceae bacterium Bs31]
MIKLLHLLLAALLVYVAYLQLNDPDPLFWAPLYLLAAAVPLLSVIKISKANTAILMGVSAGYCIAGMALTVSGSIEYLDHMATESIVQDMSPFKPYIEETREFVGTLFAFFVVLFYWLMTIKGWQPFKK